MSRRLRPRLSYANVMATLAFFVAVGGGSAVALNGTNTVFSDDIVAQNVKSSDINPGAVGNGKLAPDAVTTAKVLDNNLTGTDITNIQGSDITDESVTGSDITTETLTGSDVQNGSLTGLDVDEASLNGTLRSRELTPGAGTTITVLAASEFSGVKVSYTCPATPAANDGTIVFDNENASTVNLFIDDGGSNAEFVSLSVHGAAGETRSETAVLAGDHHEVFVDLSGAFSAQDRVLDFWSRHGATTCTTRAAHGPLIP